jgi:hypothetical protein
MRTRANTAETERRVRRLLGPADPVAGEAGPDEAVLERILAEDPRERGGHPRSYRPPRRRWVVGVAVVGVLGAGGLAARAAGVIPDDVGVGLGRAGDPGGMAPDTARARLLFSSATPDGLRLQYWEAPNRSGGLCHYMRVLEPDGRPTDSGGWSECFRGDRYRTPALWSTVDTNALSGWVAVYGRAPETASPSGSCGRTEGGKGR